MGKRRNLFCIVLVFLLILPLNRLASADTVGGRDGTTDYVRLSYSRYGGLLLWDNYHGDDKQYVKNRLLFFFTIEYQIKYVFVSHDDQTGDTTYNREVISWRLVSFRYARYWLGIDEGGFLASHNPTLKEDYINILPVVYKWDSSIYQYLSYPDLLGYWHYDKTNCDALPFRNADSDGNGDRESTDDLLYVYTSDSKYVYNDFPWLARSNAQYLHLKLIPNSIWDVDVKHVTEFYIADTISHQYHELLDDTQCNTLSYYFTIPSYLAQVTIQETSGTGDDSGDDGGSTDPPPLDDPPFTKFP